MPVIDKVDINGGYTYQGCLLYTSITISWEPVKGAQGYNVLWGIAPDKLYSSWMVYGNNELLMKSLTIDQDYYFCVEAFNENGVSLRSEVKHVK